jgi:hypothetical protein
MTASTFSPPSQHQLQSEQQSPVSPRKTKEAWGKIKEIKLGKEAPPVMVLNGMILEREQRTRR